MRLVLVLLVGLIFSSCTNLESELSGTTWYYFERDGKPVKVYEENLNVTFQSTGIFIVKDGDGQELSEQGGWEVIDNSTIEVSIIHDSGENETWTWSDVTIDGEFLTHIDEDGALIKLKKD